MTDTNDSTNDLSNDTTTAMNDPVNNAPTPADATARPNPLLAKASKLSPVVLGGLAIAVLLVAGGVGAAVARSSSKPVVAPAPPGPTLPPVKPAPLPATPDSLPPLTPDSLPPSASETPDAPTTTGAGGFRPAPITRPPNSPRPTSGIPTGGTPTGGGQAPVDPSGLPADPSGLPADPNGLPADPNGLPADPNGLPADPAGGAGTPPADPNGDGGLPGPVSNSPGNPDLPANTPDTVPGPVPAGGGTNTPTTPTPPQPDAQPPSGQPVLIANGVSITPAAGFSVTNKGPGVVFLASQNALVEVDVLAGVKENAEVLVTEIGRGYLPKTVSNLQYGQAQIAQSTSADVLSFASTSFRGVLAGSQGSLEIEGVVFVAIRQDRTALIFIGMYQPGAWEQVAPSFANMFGSMLARS